MNENQLRQVRYEIERLECAVADFQVVLNKYGVAYAVSHSRFAVIADHSLRLLKPVEAGDQAFEELLKRLSGDLLGNRYPDAEEREAGANVVWFLAKLAQLEY